MKATTIKASMILISIGLTFSCGTEKDENPQPEKTATKGVVVAGSPSGGSSSGGASLNYTYTEDIKPFMDSACAFSGCHSEASKADGYDLGTYAGTKANIGASISSIEKGKMPVEGYPEVSQQNLDMLQAWYELGLPE